MDSFRMAKLFLFLFTSNLLIMTFLTLTAFVHLLRQQQQQQQQQEHRHLTCRSRLVKQMPFEVRLMISVSLTLAVCLFKEYADYVSDQWPWCASPPKITTGDNHLNDDNGHNRGFPCVFDVWDTVIVLDSVLLAVLTLIAIKLIFFSPLGGVHYSSNQSVSGNTEALSVDGDLENSDMENVIKVRQISGESSEETEHLESLDFQEERQHWCEEENDNTSEEFAEINNAQDVETGPSNPAQTTTSGNASFGQDTSLMERTTTTSLSFSDDDHLATPQTDMRASQGDP